MGATADLTAVSLRGVQGAPIVEIAARTLAAGGAMVDTWRRLEPMVHTLTDRVGAALEGEALSPQQAASLLSLCATVIAKVGNASAGILKAAEGLTKLSLIVAAGHMPKRPAGELTEKQLVGVVIETARRIKATQGTCPLCTETVSA